MANKKRSRAQASSAAEEKPAASVQSGAKANKKPKFSKTLTAATPTSAQDSKAGHKDAQPVVKAAANSSATGPAKKNKKKNKSKSAATAAPAGDVAAKAKKVKGSEIDDLFASLKTEKLKKTIAEEQQKLAEEEEERRERKDKERLQQQIKKLEAQNTNSTAAGFNPDPRPVRYDEDGLPIYSEASLQIGKGGDTKDCPFDCWCCF